MSFKVGDEVYIRSKSIGRELTSVEKSIDISSKKVISEIVKEGSLRSETCYVICGDYYLSTDLIPADVLLPDELFEI